MPGGPSTSTLVERQPFKERGRLSALPGASMSTLAERPPAARQLAQGAGASRGTVARLAGPTWAEELGADHPLLPRRQPHQPAAVRHDEADMAPLLHTISKADRLALQRRTAGLRANQEVQAQVRAAGATAKSRMREQSWQSGTRRESLFDEKQFLQSHDQKEAVLRTRFRKLHAPIATAYWTEEEKARRAREARHNKAGRGSIAASFPQPSYRESLPAALSLDHPALRDGIDENFRRPASPDPSLGMGYKSRFGAPEPFDPQVRYQQQIESTVLMRICTLASIGSFRQWPGKK